MPATRSSRRPAMLSLLLWTMIAAATVNARADSAPPIITQVVEGDFEEVFSTLTSAITGRGINIAHTLGASDMLNRTGPDFGYAEPVYGNARIVEFCSARISHLLARADPANIVLCPFTIGVYELADQPGKVHLAYRPPHAGADPASRAAIEQVVQLLEGIVREAAAW